MNNQQQSIHAEDGSDRISPGNTPPQCGACQNPIIKDGDDPEALPVKITGLRDAFAMINSNVGTSSKPEFCEHCNCWYHTKCTNRKGISSEWLRRGRCPKCSKFLIIAEPYCDRCATFVAIVKGSQWPVLPCAICQQSTVLVAMKATGKAEAALCGLLGIAVAAAFVWALFTHQSKFWVYSTAALSLAFSLPWVFVSFHMQAKSLHLTASEMTIIPRMGVTQGRAFREEPFVHRLRKVYFSILKGAFGNFTSAVIVLGIIVGIVFRSNR